MYYICQKCGKKLSDPDSMKRGYGPECWGSIVGKQQSYECVEEEEQIPGQMNIMDYLGGMEDVENEKNMPDL